MKGYLNLHIKYLQVTYALSQFFLELAKSQLGKNQIRKAQHSIKLGNQWFDDMVTHAHITNLDMVIHGDKV